MASRTVPTCGVHPPAPDDVYVGTLPPACLVPVRAWLLRLRTGSDFAPERLPAPDPVLRMSAPVRGGAVADAHLGLACCPIFVSLRFHLTVAYLCMPFLKVLYLNHP